eukprot:scaffold55089_cov57-Attheya_sp.AAC.2
MRYYVHYCGWVHLESWIRGSWPIGKFGTCHPTTKQCPPRGTGVLPRNRRVVVHRPYGCAFVDVVEPIVAFVQGHDEALDRLRPRPVYRRLRPSLPFPARPTT